MILFFNCSDQTKQALHSFVDGKDFKNIGEVIEAAVNLYIMVQDGLGKEGSVLLEKATPNIGPQRSLNTTTSDLKAEKPSTKKGLLPDLFHWLLIDTNVFSFPLTEVKNDCTEKKFSPSKWIFGQYNRLLPAKANCRALANFQREEKGVLLTEFFKRLSLDLRSLREYLDSYDKNIADSDSRPLSAIGFPKFGPGDEKSLLRYKNHFVGSFDSKGLGRGLPFDYRFFHSTNEGVITLTSQGVRFASLQNPILDNSTDLLPGNFSKEEIEFLVDHTKRFVQHEFFAFKTIYNLVKKGVGSPQQIRKWLSENLKNNENSTETFLMSQQSGLISRMVEIGIIRREKQKQNVSYHTTNVADQIFSNI